MDLLNFPMSRGTVNMGAGELSQNKSKIFQLLSRADGDAV